MHRAGGSAFTHSQSAFPLTHLHVNAFTHFFKHSHIQAYYPFGDPSAMVRRYLSAELTAYQSAQPMAHHGDGSAVSLNEVDPFLVGSHIKLTPPGYFCRTENALDPS